MYKILIVEPLVKEIFESYENRYGMIIHYMPKLDELIIAQELTRLSCNILIVRNKKITQDIIRTWRNAMPIERLAIVRAGSNISTIDTIEAKNQNIKVMNTPGANSYAVAQYIVSQILMHTEESQAIRANQDIKNGVNIDKSAYSTQTLEKDILALIGTGAIGSKVSRVASALGMKVQAYSPNLTIEYAIQMGAIKCDSLEEAMMNANIVSIQTPYTLMDSSNYPRTYNMINGSNLELLQDGAKIINVSRRDVINIKDLELLIQSKKIMKVSLDLLKSEIEGLKLDFPNLFTSAKLFITPLIACESYKAELAITKQSLEKATNFMQENMAGKLDYTS